MTLLIIWLARCSNVFASLEEGRIDFQHLLIEKMRSILALITCLAAGSSLFAQNLAADMVITNANVHTMNTRQPTARSIAILNGKIVAVGSDADTRAMIGPKTEVI